MPAPRKNPRKQTAYVTRMHALRRKAQRDGTPCWVCGEPFDFTLPYHHAMAFTADHVQPIARGGSVTGELQPAHRSCNSRRGARDSIKVVPRPSTSRRW